jgi:hypothetical protein
MGKILFAPIIVLSALLSVSAQDRTVINDSGAKRILVGRHRLALQWVGWDYFGSAAVIERQRILYLKGRQKSRKHGDYVNVEGRIISVDKKEFRFVGKIVTQVSHIFGGKPCTRDGEMTFRITGKRRYWRLQEVDNPCEGVTDYVDLYFR